MNEGEKDAVGSASIHFQILVAGTVIFLGIFYWLTSFPEGSTFESQVSARTSSILVGVRIIGAYVALVALVLGHALLGSRNSGQ
jgi:hypothetical protein